MQQWNQFWTIVKVQWWIEKLGLENWRFCKLGFANGVFWVLVSSKRQWRWSAGGGDHRGPVKGGGGWPRWWCRGRVMAMELWFFWFFLGADFRNNENNREATLWEQLLQREDSHRNTQNNSQVNFYSFKSAFPQWIEKVYIWINKTKKEIENILKDNQS